MAKGTLPVLQVKPPLGGRVENAANHLWSKDRHQLKLLQWNIVYRIRNSLFYRNTQLGPHLKLTYKNTHNVHRCKLLKFALFSISYRFSIKSIMYTRKRVTIAEIKLSHYLPFLNTSLELTATKTRQRHDRNLVRNESVATARQSREQAALVNVRSHSRRDDVSVPTCLLISFTAA